MLHLVQVTYPKRTDKPLYHGLVKQLESLYISFLPPEDVTEGRPLRERYDVVIDAIFGFSFHGSPRPPFDTIVQVMCSVSPQVWCEPCIKGVQTFEVADCKCHPAAGMQCHQRRHLRLQLAWPALTTPLIVLGRWRQQFAYRADFLLTCK